ncbi:MAG: glycosyltransferase [bacterium]
MNILDLFELFDFFQRYVADTGSQLQLVLLGKAVMEIPQHPQIRALGFVSETDKYAGLSGAECLIMPSPYESLSIVLLEAWMSNIPVLVTATCDVLKAQTTRAQGGLWYKTYEEFKDGINTLIGDRQRADSMASSGRAYTEKTYKWSKIESDYLSLISKTEEAIPLVATPS